VVKWADQAKADLKAIHDYIARDSTHYAKKVTQELVEKTDALAEVPRLGRVAGARRRQRPRDPRLLIPHPQRDQGRRRYRRHAMNAQAEKTLLEKLKTLPPARLAEVEDFVDFLKAREERTRDEAARRLGEAFEKLDALNTPPMTSEEVQAEIDAARAERRARADRR
jgi:plasmid stabilization system protein ParE